MSIPPYDKGDLVRLTGTFTDANGNPQDPEAVNLDVRAPGAAAANTYAYPAQIAKTSTGVYTYDLNANVSGRWRYRFYATGSGQASEEKEIHVRPDMA